MRNGTSPFGTSGMDTSRNRSSLMLQNKLDPWTRARQSQFPPPRIPPQFLPSSRMLTGGAAAAAVAAATAAGATGQPSLGMLCDVAMGGATGGSDLGGSKRGTDALSSSMGNSNKRFKHQLSPFKTDLPSGNSSKPVLLKDNPVLLERISSLGGGFKWGGFGKSLAKSKASQQAESKKQQPPPTRIGAFPMPTVDGRKPDLLEKKPSLASYKALWRSIEHELRQEVLSRRLQRGHVKIVNATGGSNNEQQQRSL